MAAYDGKTKSLNIPQIPQQNFLCRKVNRIFLFVTLVGETLFHSDVTPEEAGAGSGGAPATWWCFVYFSYQTLDFFILPGWKPGFL